MANIQKYFESFHDKIRMDYDMNSELAEKRDIVLGLVSSYLQDQGLPAFQRILQGSYRMKTGVRPIDDLEYDIDVGLCFSIDPTKYSVATVRGWVLASVNGHTDKVEDKGPCIRVHYAKGFHIDLVVYAQFKDAFGQSKMKLAHKTRGWVDADPAALLAYVDNAMSSFSGSEDSATKTGQLRRVIRYLKRWSDERFEENAEKKPSGIAFTLFAISILTGPRYSWDGKSDDLAALLSLVERVPSIGRLSILKPTPEYEDVFGKLSNDGMEDLKDGFLELGDALKEAQNDGDPVKACRRMNEVLGSDFPVPNPSDDARKTRSPAIVTSSSAA